jgi:ribosome-dependent ATPase
LIATGLSHELAAVTPSGKLDDAFTHFQGDSGHDNQPLVIPPRPAPTTTSPSKPTT